MKFKSTIGPAFLVVLFFTAALYGCADGEKEEILLLKGTVAALSTRQVELENANMAQNEFISYLATRPPIVVTPVGPDTSPTPYRPVDGKVMIEDGRCCVGGPAGEPLKITITLDAFSPQSEITDMRIAVGSRFLTEEEMETVPWEAFTRQKEVIIPVPANWSGSYASVQFRNAEGDLSFVFHDDISVEGESK
jgi:hypothetical protein